MPPIAHQTVDVANLLLAQKLRVTKYNNEDREKENDDMIIMY